MSDLGDLFGVYEGSRQTPINTLDKMFEMSSNPLFMYLTGVMSPNQLRTAVDMATWEPVDISGADYYTMLEADADDPVLLKAYQLIMQGVSTNAALRSILDSYNPNNTPQDANKQNLYFDYAQSAIEQFKAAWDKAQDIEAGYTSGKYRESADGGLLQRMDATKASDVLKQMGMPGVLQNTFVWDVVPDDKLLAIAASKDEYAQRILKPFADMIDPATGMLIQKEAQKIAKQATAVGQSAYEAMLNQTKEGRAYLESADSQTFAPTTASKAAANPAVMPTSRQASGLDPMPGDDKPKSKMTPAEERLASHRSGQTAQQQEQWAKLAQSYAGRAEQERLTKPVTTARELAIKATEEADEYRQASISPERGSIPAIDMLNQAFPMASVLSQAGEQQVGMPFLGGARSGGWVKPIQQQWLEAKKDPRLKKMTPQQIEVFSKLFASGR